MAEESNAKGVYYIIREGDTLWAISGRFYQDPYLWPYVWAGNQYIDNPHWIFPGNRIFLADIPGGVGTQPQAGAAPEEVAALGLAIPEALTDKALLTEEPLKPQGWIVASEDYGIMLYEGEKVFLNMGNTDDVAVGDVCQVLRKGRKLKHPKSGKKLGTLYHVLGYLRLSNLEQGSAIATARILSSNYPIEVGDFVIKKNMPEATAFYSKPSGRSMTGYVVANVQDPVEITEHDICVIDKGILDGVEVGDTFWVLEPGKKVKRYGEKPKGETKIDGEAEELSARFEGNKIQMPAEKIGTLVVIRTEKIASTALVTSSRSPFHAGAPIIAKLD